MELKTFLRYEYYLISNYGVRPYDVLLKSRQLSSQSIHSQSHKTYEYIPTSHYDRGYCRWLLVNAPPFTTLVV